MAGWPGVWQFVQGQHAFDETAGVLDALGIPGQAAFQRNGGADIVKRHRAYTLFQENHGDSIEPCGQVLVFQAGVGNTGIMRIPAGVIVYIDRRKQCNPCAISTTRCIIWEVALGSRLLPGQQRL